MVCVGCGASPLLPGDLLSPQLGFVHLGGNLKWSGLAHPNLGAFSFSILSKPGGPMLLVR